MIQRKRIVTATGATALLVLLGTVALLQPASATMLPRTSTSDLLQAQMNSALAQKANCQLLVAHSSGTQKTRAQDCVNDQIKIITLLGQVTPSPTATSTTAPPTTAPPTTAPPTTAPPTTFPPTTAPPTTEPPTTAPPTTPPPTTVPPATTSFLTGPASGVGPAVGSANTPIAQNQIQANTVYDGYAIPGGVYSQSGITFKNCTIGDVEFDGDNITLDHCTVNGGVSISGGDNFKLTHNNLVNWSDGIHITSDSGPVVGGDIEYNWVHNPHNPLSCAAHSDGLQMLGATTVVISHNVIDLGPWQSCDPNNPFDGPKNGDQCELTQGPVDGITWDDDYLNGGVIIFRVYGCKNVHLTNSFFGNDMQASEGDTLTAGTGFVWTNNRNFYTNALVARS